MTEKLKQFMTKKAMTIIYEFSKVFRGRGAGTASSFVHTVVYCLSRPLEAPKIRAGKPKKATGKCHVTKTHIAYDLFATFSLKIEH